MNRATACRSGKPSGDHRGHHHQRHRIHHRRSDSRAYAQRRIDRPHGCIRPPTRSHPKPRPLHETDRRSDPHHRWNLVRLPRPSQPNLPPPLNPGASTSRTPLSPLENAPERHDRPATLPAIPDVRGTRERDHGRCDERSRGRRRPGRHPGWAALMIRSVAAHAVRAVLARLLSSLVRDYGAGVSAWLCQVSELSPLLHRQVCR